MQKILIVEDDLAIQALLHDFIQEAGYEVTLASDGVEALSYFPSGVLIWFCSILCSPKLTATECVKLSGENPIFLLLCSQLWTQKKIRSRD